MKTQDFLDLVGAPWSSYHDHAVKTVAADVATIRPTGMGPERFEREVCNIYGCESAYTDIKAMQRARRDLVAAAPDLYAALAMFVEQWNACGPNSDFGRYFGNVREAAVKALAKAEGESA